MTRSKYAIGIGVFFVIADLIALSSSPIVSIPALMLIGLVFAVLGFPSFTLIRRISIDVFLGVVLGIIIEAFQSITTNSGFEQFFVGNFFTVVGALLVVVGFRSLLKGS